MDTFFWRRKRKYLGCRAETRRKSIVAMATPLKQNTPYSCKSGSTPTPAPRRSKTFCFGRRSAAS
ncbi:hypothetical protein C2U68_19610 [Methylomonas koyamae]|nr:hypothetical protein C2U68_19610 [Methylomonas koyamae]